MNFGWYCHFYPPDRRMFVNVFHNLLSLFPRRYFYIFSVLLIITLIGLHWDTAVPETSLGEQKYEKTNVVESRGRSTVSSTASTLQTRSKDEDGQNKSIATIPVAANKRRSTYSTEKPKSSRTNRRTTVTVKPSESISEDIGQKKNNTKTELSTEAHNESVRSSIVTANSTQNMSYNFNVKQSAAASRLPRNGSLFCWVLAAEKNFNYKVPAVNQTWLKRCDRGEFFTTEPIKDESIPFSTVFAGLNDSYDELFYKSIRALHYSYTHLSKDFDWYFKADDDTYVIVENLRKFLSKYNPKVPLFFGLTWNDLLPNGFNSGGPGYVLSNAAMKIFAEELYHNRTLCSFHTGEDVGIARCLASKGILPSSTKNAKNEERFCHTTIDQAIKTSFALADDLISLHWLRPDEIRVYDYLLYRVKRNEEHNHINTIIPA